MQAAIRPFLLLPFLAVCAAQAQDFVHPGVIHTQADLDRMRVNAVVTPTEPWISGYNAFIADSRSSSSYAMQGPYATITRSPIGSVNLGQWENDCGAAYQNAIRWAITGSTAHANKARSILVGWAGTCTAIIGSDARLTAGLQGHKFIAAAEILRHGKSNGVAYGGWTATDTATVSNFIRNVLLPLNRMYGGGNWGNIGAISQMAAGVFLDDEAEFTRAVNAMKYGAPTECDMGMDHYIDPVGWTTEADRDIGHWALGLNNLGVGAHIAWCQGVDLWSYLSNRLLVGHEYLASYNLGNAVNPSMGAQCDELVNGGITTDGWGRWDISFYEQAYHPYQNLLGVPAPFTEIAVENTRAFFAGGTASDFNGDTYTGYNDGIEAERYDRDHVGFGTLVYALPPRIAGLPVVPADLTATAGNATVSLAWSAASGADRYNVKRATTRGGPYATLATGVTATDFTDNAAVNGTRYDYRVSAVNGIGETADSGLAAAYPSGTAPAAPTGVTATTTSHRRIDLAWVASTGATSYTIRRATASGGPYTDIATGEGTAFLQYADTGLSPDMTYHYVVAAVNSVDTGSNSTPVFANTLPALPSPWSFEDAGYDTTPGSATYAAGQFTVKGAGLDYGGNRADSFGFASMSLTGDGQIVARLADRSSYSHLSKIGLTMRESTAGGSKHAFVLIDGADSAGFVFRNSTGSGGSGAGSVNVAGSTTPRWLKLSRVGSTFTGSVSPDGTTWTQINSVSIAMNSTLLVGLAVCSRNNGHLDTAVFDNLSVGGWTPPSTPPPAPTDLSATATSGSTVSLSWSAATTATGYSVKRATVPGGPYTTLATNVTATTYSDSGLTLGTPYHYVVSATNAIGESPNSSEAVATPVEIVTMLADGFENGLGNWSNVGGDTDNWTRDSGGTPSNNTGPATGADGSAWYVYLETSNGGASNAGDTALLESPDLAGGSRTLTFRYHMYGSNMGTLNVDVFHNGSWIPGVWSRSGQQHTSSAQAYTLATVNLGAFAGTLRLRFRGVAAGNYRGDMAIDDVVVTGDPTVTPPVPAGVSAVTASPSAIDLTWSPASGATGYSVKRATVSGGPYTTLASNVAGTTYLDTDLTAGATYFYVVSASNSSGESANSPEVSAVPGTVVPVRHWKLDETGGTTAADSIGFQHGTLSGGAAWVPGAIGNAVSLSGTSTGYVDFPTGVVATLSNFTVAAWVKVNASANWARIFDFGTGTDTHMFLTPQTNGGVVRFAMRNGGGGEERISGSAPLPVGAWTHVAVTLSGTVGTLYVNGAPVGTNAGMTLRPSSLGGTTQNWLGRSQYSADPFLNGLVDDFRIYNIALGAVENWRLTHFGTIENSGSAADDADPDGDGATNEEEYAAGTDPRDPGDALVADVAVATGGPGFDIRFLARAGRSYLIEYKDDLGDSSWQPLHTVPVVGADTDILHTDTAAGTRRFYRVRTPAP